MPDHPWLANYPPEVDYDAPLEPKPLYALIDAAEKQFRDNPYLEFQGRRWSYGQVAEMIRRAARGFQDLGVGPGVKVGIFLPNCPQFVVAFYGILKAGGTVVNYSPLYSERELLHQIEDSDTDIMVTIHLKVLYDKMDKMLAQSRLAKLVVATMPEVLPFPKNLLFPLLRARHIARIPSDSRHLWFRELIANEGDFRPVDADPSDVAVLQYTGGTTGVPKGAMLSHGALYINARQAHSWVPGFEPGRERLLAVLPLFHVFAMTNIMNVAMCSGAEIILHPRFDVDAVLKDIDAKRPTFFSGVPAMFTAMLNHPELGSYDLSSLKYCGSGGAPMPVETKQRFEKLTGCELVEGYGLTETSPSATSNPFGGLNKPGSIGIPLPGTRILITDRDDPRKVLPQGEVGEICVEGPQLMLGYYKRPEATAETIIDGRLRTGDVGYMDQDGYTFIIDRMKDMILRGGFNVFPRHIEEAIYEHPAVEEVTVIGIPDERLGEVPKAFVKLKQGEPGIPAEKLLDFLADRLGKHELPTEIEFRDELPKTPVGKLSKKELVAEEAEKRGREVPQSNAPAESIGGV